MDNVRSRIGGRSSRRLTVRRDVFIRNDSGGFSVLAASAAPAIINERLDQLNYVMTHQVLLLELFSGC